MRVFLSSGYYGSSLQVFGMPFQYVSSNLTISVEFYWIIILGMSSYSIPLVFFFTASYYNYGGSSLPGFPYLTFFLKFPFNPLCCLFSSVTFSPLSFICEMFSFFFLSWALLAFSYSPVVLLFYLFSFIVPITFKCFIEMYTLKGWIVSKSSLGPFHHPKRDPIQTSVSPCPLATLPSYATTNLLSLPIDLSFLDISCINRIIHVVFCDWLL